MSEDFVRIPVSLKVYPGVDFVDNLVIPKRDNRELSEFILNLLQAYHEEPEVRVRMDEFILKLSPAYQVFQQLGRIQEDHAKTVLGASLLGHQVAGVQDQLRASLEGETMAPPGSSASSDFDRRLAMLESQVSSIPEVNSKLDQVLMALAGGNGAPVQPVQSAPLQSAVPSLPAPPPFEEPTAVPVSAPAPAAPILFEEEPAEGVNLTFTPAADVLGSGGPPSPLLIADDDEPEEPEEQPTNRPSSFAKMKGSLGKKRG